jgi:hypothetical protein
MDIIASHQGGLIEQLEAEATALAGRACDSVQRAITCHHVADMLGLAHGYALLAAEASLALDEALARLERQAGRWRWSVSRTARAELVERARVFAAAARRIDGERCAGVLMAYRLVATPGLGGEAKRRLDSEMLASLQAVQSTRGETDRDARRALFDAHARWAEKMFGAAVDEAVAALGWPHGPKAVRAVVAALLIPAAQLERAERRGLWRVEARLRKSKRMPEGFAANPAQAFFKLQRQIIERRRRGADVDQFSPDEAVKLAA